MFVRVAADRGRAGGQWNGPCDSTAWEFCYVPIPEHEGRVFRCGLATPYSMLATSLATFATELPQRLASKYMHLDPDFEHLTYGDQGQRASQIAKLGESDILVFYASFVDIRNPNARLVYAIIGTLCIKTVIAASEVSSNEWHTNAHSRRALSPDALDIVVKGKHKTSGRLRHCLPFGEFRDGAYRVRRDILHEWGGLKVRNGYVQRSVYLPLASQPAKFIEWFKRQEPILLHKNNE
jgi:Nucleotide modification associated domain 3